MELNAIEESSKIRPKEMQLDWALRRSLVILPAVQQTRALLITLLFFFFPQRDCCLKMSEVKLREVLYTGCSSLQPF